MFRSGYIFFHCVVLCTVCMEICTVLLPPGVNPTAVNKHITSYHITNRGWERFRLEYKLSRVQEYAHGTQVE